MNTECNCSTNSKGKNLHPDIMIIGAGSGGFSAAITAAEMGATVVIAGDGVIGGTCVNIGCVPSKTLIRAMESVYHPTKAARFDGIEANSRVIDWKALVTQKQSLVEALRQAKYTNLLPSYPKISYVEGKATVVGDTVVVNGQKYLPKKIIISTGSSAMIPDIDGIEDVSYLTSTEALNLETLPKSLIVIGGGYIGCELSQMFARAGVKVTICCRSRLLPKTEPEISRSLKECFQKEGVDVMDGIYYKTINQHEDSVILSFEREGHSETIEGENVLIASGHKPNSLGFGLEEVNVEFLKNGGIRIDEYMQSTNPNIYAVGDVTGKDLLVYMAAYGGKIAAQNALKGNNLSYDNTCMPAVVFTDPQVADVGLTEEQAMAQGLEVKTSLITLDNVPRFIASRNTRGVIKLVADAKTNRLIGAHIFAPEAGDSIQTIVIAMKAAFTTSELANTIFPYLTAVEGLKLAAQTFDKDVSKLSCCAG